MPPAAESLAPSTASLPTRIERCWAEPHPMVGRPTVSPWTVLICAPPDAAEPGVVVGLVEAARGLARGDRSRRARHRRASAGTRLTIIAPISSTDMRVAFRSGTPFERKRLSACATSCWQVPASA